MASPTLRNFGFHINTDTEFDPPEYDYDVITVHGIRDHQHAAWYYGKDGDDCGVGTSWVRDQLFRNRRVREINYSYGNDHRSYNVYQPLGLFSIAADLLVGYEEIRKELTEIFLGTPNPIQSKVDLQGQIPQDQVLRNQILQDQIQKLLLLPGPEVQHEVPIEVLARDLVVQVYNFNEEFLETGLRDRVAIFNVFAINSPGVESEGQPGSLISFPQSTYQGGPFEVFGRTWGSSVDHLDLVYGEKTPRMWVSEVSDAFNESGRILEIDHCILQYQAWLFSLAPPTRALDVPPDPTLSKAEVVKWLYKQEAFCAFSKFGPGPRLMHIHGNGSPLVDISELSRLFYTHYEASGMDGKARKESDRSMIYFEFDRRDSRYDNISSMLTYLISTIMCHLRTICPRRLVEELSFLKATRAWSLEDLYHLYTTFRDGIYPTHKPTIFISCFDQCPEGQRKWFLQRVLEEQSYSETQYRIIVSTSTRDGLAIESFPDGAHVNLADCPTIGKSMNGLTADLQSSLTVLIKIREYFKDFRPQIESLLMECRDTPYLGHIILSRLENGSPTWWEFGIAEMIDDLSPPTIENIVRSLMFSLMPDHYRLRAKNAFNWVKHASEPWSLESLVEGLATYYHTDCGDEMFFMDGVIEELGGIIIVKNGHVKFSHPSFYDVIEVGTHGSTEERAAIVNSEIAEACLRYFLLEESEENLDKFSPGNFKGGPWETALDATMASHPSVSFAEYAVRFWPQHYKASGQFKPRNLVDKLFATTEYRAGWEVPSWLFSNPFTRIQRSYEKSMPVLAMLGLDDWVRQLVKSGRGQPFFEKTCWLAITEAARVGNESIVYRLLKEVAIDEEELRTALFWAVAHGNANIVNALVEKIPNPGEFRWPENIIYRAAAVGMNKLLTTMLSSGYDINTTSSYRGMSLLEIAVWRNCVSTTELLLSWNPKPDLTIKNEDGDTPVVVAATKGNPRIIELLLEGGASDKMEDECKLGLVELAVRGKKHKAVEMFIKAGADFGGGEKGDDAPLLVAANVGSRECVRVLLKYGADPNIGSATGTPLYKAVMNSYEDVVWLLLNNRRKPDMSVTPPRQAMLLIRAVCTGNTKLVSMLIKHGAGVDAIDPNGDFYKTPLSRACKEGHLGIVELLLKNKAGINYSGGGSNAPLFAALYGDQVEVAKYLLRYKNVDVKWKKSDGMGCLHAAYDLPDIIVELLKRGVPIDDYMKNYGTTLHMAARMNRPKSIEALVRNDPKPDLECLYRDGVRSGNEVGCTPLLLACLHLAPECVRLLLLAGANPRAENESGDDGVDLVLRTGSDSKDALECLKLLCSRTPVYDVNKQRRSRLHYIQQTTPVSVVQPLLEDRALLNGRDRHGYTPLAVAVRKGNIDVAEYLVKQGAKVNVLSPTFGSILHLAVAGGFADLVMLLVESGADCKAVHPEYDESLLYTALNIEDGSKLEHMVYLLALIKAPPDQPGGELRYPILRAADMMRDNFELGHHVLLRLMDQKASFHSIDIQGRSALHFACAAPHSKGVETLLLAGSEVDEGDRFGRMPIHFAASSPSPDCMRYLLYKFPDIDVDVADHDGWTPLMWAARSGHGKTIDLLLERGAEIGRRGHDYSGKWSPLRLMNFAGNCTWLKERLYVNSKEESWDPDIDSISAGHRKDVSCKSCLVCIGYQYDKIYDSERPFEKIGPTYDPELEDEDEGSDSDSDSDSDSTSASSDSDN
ncbi:hypothetical protein Hte_003341 [Hypoxylon texense]